MASATFAEEEGDRNASVVDIRTFHSTFPAAPEARRRIHGRNRERTCDVSRGRRIVGDRVLLDFREFGFSDESRADIGEALESLGFGFRTFDVVEIARSRLHCSQYHQNAPMGAAPRRMDASSFVKWVFEIAGVWLPRLPVQQAEEGNPIDPRSIRAGDVIFMSGAHDRSRTDGAPGIGHVGIVTSKDSVIHFPPSGITEDGIEPFLGPKGRGVRRLIPKRGMHTVYCPLGLDIETTDDIYWMLRDRLNP